MFLRRLPLRKVSASRKNQLNVRNCSLKPQDALLAKLKVTDSIEGYVLQKILPVPELNIVGSEFKHVKTGAKHIHIATEDITNSFSVSFKTPVNSDNGVTHILEHMVLCGSNKYPVKDPFFKMLSRSVSTFMNAMTFPDHTVYPFATPNTNDFYNLLSVYLDCVFNPCLRYADFRQEAWRIGRNRKENNAEEFQGVVFNEMKGAMTSQVSIHQSEFVKNMLPTTYQYNYGGDPLDIVNLEYKELLNYHQKYYHPAGSLFITYGNIPVESHLKYINENFLDSFPVSNFIMPELKNESSWATHKSLNRSMPFDTLLPLEKQHVYTHGYKIDMSNYHMDKFLMSVLSNLLLDGAGSPFNKSLLMSGIGTDYCAVTGFDSYTKDPLFGVGLKGITKNDRAKIDEIINQTFQDVSEKGFTSEHVLGLLKKTELSLKHVKANTGINYTTGLPTCWTHGHDILDSLRINEYIKHVSENYDKGLFENLVKKHFIGNQHMIMLQMDPTDDFNENLKKKEADILEQKLTIKIPAVKDKVSIIKDLDEVDKILPKIGISDLPTKYSGHLAETQFSSNGVSVQTSCQPTNGLSYINMILDTSAVPLLLRSYLPLFAYVLSNVGAGEYDHVKMSERVSLNSSDLNCQATYYNDLSNIDKYEECLSLSSYSTCENFENALSIWKDLFIKPHFFSDPYVKSLISEYIDSHVDSLCFSAHMYSMTRSACYQTKSGQYDEKLNGLSQIEFLKDLSSEIAINENGFSDIVEKLISIASHLLDRSKLKCFVVSMSDEMPRSLDLLSEFLNELPEMLTEITPEQNDESPLFTKSGMKEFIYMPYRVNYNSKSYRIVNYLHEDYPIFKVLGQIITLKHLLPEVREKGGAYGAGVSINNGCFSMYSYRDPNFDKTYEAFDQSFNYVLNNLDEKTLEEAIVKIIGQIDAPVSPSKRTLSYFTHGLTNEHIQNYREKVYSCKKEDILNVIKKYFVADDSLTLPVGSPTCVSIGDCVPTPKKNKLWNINSKYIPKEFLKQE